MRLKDWTPLKRASSINKATEKHLEKRIIEEYDSFSIDSNNEKYINIHWNEYINLLRQTTFNHKYMFSFVELEDGTLIGFNENPSHGHTFPVGNWKRNKQNEVIS